VARDVEDTADYDAREFDLGAPVLLTKDQACAWAQVGRGKMAQWLTEPDFPAIKTPRHVRIHAKLFEQWLANRAKEGLS